MADDLESLLRGVLEAPLPGALEQIAARSWSPQDVERLSARLAEVVRPMFENLTAEAILLAKRERDEARREMANLEHLLDILRAPRKVRHPEGGEVDLNLAGRLDVLINPRNEGADAYRTPAELMDALDGLEAETRR